MPNILNKFVTAVSSGITNNLFSKQQKSIAISRQLGNTPYPGVYLSDAQVGLVKNSKISFDQLRLIASSDTVIRICINTIKKAVSQAGWAIVPRKLYIDTYDKTHIVEASKFFELVNTQGDNLRSLLDALVEDILVCDAGVTEKIPNPKGETVELTSADGATFRPLINKYGEIGGYVQVIENKVVAEFKPNEIIYIMMNPQNDIRYYGFGRSCIEEILLTVQASLNADLYNAKMFGNDNIPPGILDLGNMNTEEAQGFIALWNATVVNNTQKLKFVWGSDNPKKYTSFNGSNKDMQYMKYVDWLSRLKLAAFGLTSLDANITGDVNRATSITQAQLTQARGVANMFALIEDYFNREILVPKGWTDVEFKFERLSDMNSKLQQAQIDQIYVNIGVIPPEDVAKREGFDAYSEEGKGDTMDYGAPPVPEENITPTGTSNVENTLQEPVAQKNKKPYFKPLYK